MNFDENHYLENTTKITQVILLTLTIQLFSYFILFFGYLFSVAVFHRLSDETGHVKRVLSNSVFRESDRSVLQFNVV